MTKYRMVCNKCGGDNIVADVYAAWNYDTQAWEVESTHYKGGWCYVCGSECSVNDVAVEPVNE